MKRFLALFMSLLLAGCGTQEYAKPPAVGSDKERPSDLLRNSEVLSPDLAENTLTNGALAAEPSGKGHAWRWLEWYGIPEKDVDKLRCRLRDPDGVKAMDAFGAAIDGGIIIGIVARASGSVFFGKPADDYSNGHGHGHHGHHGHHQDIHVTIDRPDRSVWGHLTQAIRNVSVAGLNGAVFFGGCQTILAGGNWTSFDGLLGNEYAAIAAAIPLGVGSAVAAKPWLKRLFPGVRNFFGKLPPPRDPTMDTSLLHTDPPPVLNGGLPPKGSGLFKRMAKWGKAHEFERGLWYNFLPGVSILFISESVGVMIYHKLTKDAEQDLIDAPFCEAL